MSSILKKIWDELRWIIKVSRPRFWIYLFGPFLLGIVGGIRHIGWTNLSLSERINALKTFGYVLFTEVPKVVIELFTQEPLTALSYVGVFILLFGYFLFPANLLLYGVNDLFDTDTDALNPKKDNYELRLTQTKRGRLPIYILLIQIPWIISCTILVARALSMGAIHAVPVVLAFLVFVLLSVFYSAPPIRAKARPVLDSLFNILYVIPALITYIEITSVYENQIIFPWLPFIAGSLWCVAMHAYSAIPDIEADKKAKLDTIATKLGAYNTTLVCLGLYAASAVIASLATPSAILSYIFLTCGMIYVGMMSVSLSRLNDLMPIYKRFPLINTLVGMVVFFALVLL